MSHCCCLCVCMMQLDILRALLLDETLLLVDHLLVRHHPLLAASCTFAVLSCAELYCAAWGAIPPSSGNDHGSITET